MENQNTPQEGIPPAREEWQSEQPESHLEREDERWSFRNQLRDWGILLVMVIIYLAWTGIVYFFEPGIR
ncbi:MAG: hypothetical protein ACK2UW_20205 [Anaerolineales bacterium]